MSYPPCAGGVSRPETYGSAALHIRGVRYLSFALFADLAGYTSGHTSQGRTLGHALSRGPAGDLFQCFSTTSHSAWGRVVPDIPDFCRELVAALAEQ
jgi:hypothetical protein